MSYAENETGPPLNWEDTAIDYPIDRATFECLSSGESQFLKACTFSGDFDGDHHVDHLTWVLEETTLRFDMLVRWGDTGKSSIVGLGPWGHINPARGRPVCAESSFEVSIGAWQAYEPHEVVVRHLVIAEGQPPRDVLTLDTAWHKWIWFEDGHWRAAIPFEDQIPPQFPHVDHEWSGDDAPVASASACKEARRIRKRAHRKRGVERILGTKAKDVARDPCTSTLDLDGDGDGERVSWVVDRGATGLRIDWPDGRVSVLGAGRPVPIDALEGEPGCNFAMPSFDEIWNVEVAHWNGDAWRLGKRSTHVPFDRTRIEGDALALTNMHGHVDLVFLVDGELRYSAVPFAWHEVRVLFPYNGEWSQSRPPLPEVRRYSRPRAMLRSRVAMEGVEDLPKLENVFAGFG